MFETSGIRRCKDGSIDTDYYIASAKDCRSEAATRATKRFAERAFDLVARNLPRIGPTAQLSVGPAASGNAH